MERVNVDTTMQIRAVAYPMDDQLMLLAIERLGFNQKRGGAIVCHWAS